MYGPNFRNIRDFRNVLRTNRESVQKKRNKKQMFSKLK